MLNTGESAEPESPGPKEAPLLDCYHELALANPEMRVDPSEQPKKGDQRDPTNTGDLFFPSSCNILIEHDRCFSTISEFSGILQPQHHIQQHDFQISGILLEDLVMLDWKWKRWD